MFLVVVGLLFSVICACVGEPIKFNSCNVPGTIESVDVYPCPAQPCIFRHGINGTIKVTFNTDICLERVLIEPDESIYVTVECKRTEHSFIHPDGSFYIEIDPNCQSGKALSLKAELYAIIAGVSASFHLPNPDGCKDSGITCPIKVGSILTYQTTLPVLKQYPSIRLVVKWVLRDENNNMQFCFKFPVEIK